MKRLLINLINIYQRYLSFDRGLLFYFAPAGACRFDTTCSEYTKRMVDKFGILKGGLLGIKRIWSCR